LADLILLSVIWRGIEVGIPNGRKPGTCPVRLLKAWLEFAEVKSGPIFRPISKGGNIGASRLGEPVGGPDRQADRYGQRFDIVRRAA
jgi:hypothetical protein